MSDYPGLFRRLAAIVYDALIVTAILIAATAAALLARGGESIEAGTLWFQGFLGIIALAYFAGSWRHGGQTIGMVPWRLRVVGRDGASPGWGRCLARGVLAPLSLLAGGAGFAWAWIDKERRTWHDLATGTRIVFSAPGRAQQPSPPTAP